MIKEKRFLITTALERTWAQDQPVLFLGEWCRRYSRKSRWSKMDAVVQPYHWDDRERFYADYIYLNELYERVLASLYVKLNEIHDVDYSLRYWRILVGPWLAYFIHIVFDRWMSIKNALESYEITGMFSVSNQISLVANDMYQFADFCIRDEWNEQLYLEIVNRLSDVPITFMEANSNSKVVNWDSVKKHSTIKMWALNLYSKIAKRFVNDHDLFINASYLTKFNEAVLQLKLGQIPHWWIKPLPEQLDINLYQRRWDISVDVQNDFESFILSLIPAQIPIVYLEGFKKLTSQVQALPWPKSPKLIFSSNVLWHNDVSMKYVAEKTELGIPLVYGQHGGGYGTARFHFAEEHEVEISDRYLSWGWNDSRGKKVSPIGIFKISKPNKDNRKFNRKRKLLYLTLGIPRYSYRLCSESAINYQNYIYKNFELVSQLKTKIIHNFLLRLSLNDCGQDSLLRWHERFPSIKIDKGFKKIKPLMRSARLVVHTYNQTGFLESLALGIPTVLFCQLDKTQLRETAAPYYGELKRVGIFHDCPLSAALHINNVWDDVDAWWGNDEVQQVIALFKKQYCHQPKNILDEIHAVFHEVINNSSNKTVGLYN